jgi:hypothetical protein
MKTAAYVLDVDGVRYAFQVFDEIEPKFDEALIERNIRAGKYEPGIIDAPTPMNWILNSGEYTGDLTSKALADSIPFSDPVLKWDSSYFAAYGASSVRCYFRRHCVFLWV